MESSWIVPVATGAVVGLAFGLGPLVRDGLRLMGLVRYINMDLVHFHQLYATGGDDALAFPLSQKLSEKGALLSWKTQRELTALREACEGGGTPLEAGAYESLVGSLEEYRNTVGLISEHAGVPEWRVNAPFVGPVPSPVAQTLKTIERDWHEFRKHATFLRSYLKRYTSIGKKKT